MENEEKLYGVLKDIHESYVNFLTENYPLDVLNFEKVDTWAEYPKTVAILIDRCYHADWAKDNDFSVIEDRAVELGEQSYLIFKFKNRFYRLNYRYASYNETRYYGDGRDIKEVFPREVLQTVYD